MNTEIELLITWDATRAHVGLGKQFYNATFLKFMRLMRISSWPIVDEPQVYRNYANCQSTTNHKTNGVFICDWQHSDTVALNCKRRTELQERQKLSLALSSKENNDH